MQQTNKQTSYQGYDAPLQSYTFKKKKEIRQETKTVIIIKIQISKIHIYIYKKRNREKLKSGKVGLKHYFNVMDFSF